MQRTPSAAQRSAAQRSEVPTKGDQFVDALVHVWYGRDEGNIQSNASAKAGRPVASDHLSPSATVLLILAPPSFDGPNRHAP